MFWILHQTLYTHIGVIKVSYTKNEIALETLISNVNSFFYYVGEDDDLIPFPRYEIRERLDNYVSQFMQSIEVEGDND